MLKRWVMTNQFNLRYIDCVEIKTQNGFIPTSIKIPDELKHLTVTELFWKHYYPLAIQIEKYTNDKFDLFDYAHVFLDFKEHHD